MAMVMTMVMLALQGQDAVVPPSPSVEAIMARTRDVTGVQTRCVYNPNATDITVCGLRQADRFRVPFVEHDPGDPRHESLAAERVLLLNARTPVQDMGPFQVGGGMAGVSVGVGAAGVTAGGLRKPAP